MSSHKRKPFSEAPRDLGNRFTSSCTNPKQTRDPPPRLWAKSAKSTSLSGAARARCSSAGVDKQTRQYQAQAYSDKVTIASQTQRIEALQAELDEVRLFASVERSSSGENSQVKASVTNDGELIEALAQELDSSEADLKAAQSQVRELEKELQSVRRSQSCHMETACTDSSTTTKSSTIELKKVIEHQRKELEQYKKDEKEGVVIMGDLEKALRVAKSNSEASQAARDEAWKSAERYQIQMEGVRLELEKSQQQCRLLEKSKEMVKEEQSVMATKYANLETSFIELQNTLRMVQSRSEEKTASMKEALLEAEKKEEQSVMEYQILMKRYNEVQRQYGEMEETLSKVQAEVVQKENEVQLVEENNRASIQVLEKKHADDMERQQTAFRKEARVMYKAVLAKKEAEHNSDSIDEEMRHIKTHLQQMEKEKDMIKAENTKLKTENVELLRKIETGIAMYNETASLLAAKTAEVAAASIDKNVDAELIALNGELKKDLTSAVESSISRGKQVKSLEKKIELYQLKLTKANQKIKRLEKVASLSAESEGGVSTQVKQVHEEKQLLESQVSSLRLQAKETESTISNMAEEISAKASQVQTLQRDLTTARRALTNSQSRVSDLEQALLERETALQFPINDSRKVSGSDYEESEIRKHIEKIALQEYVAQKF